MGAFVSYKRGNSVSIESVPKVDGQLLFTTDKGHIYLDNGTDNRIEFYATDLQTLTDAIALLNGTADKGGSVASKVAAAKSELIGTTTDSKTIDTINGAKAYTKEVQDSLKTVAISGAAADVTVADEGNNFEGTNVESVLKELAGKAKTNTISMETSGETGNILKSYTLKQGDSVIGTIDIPKDLVVQSGEIVNTNGTQMGTFIKLVLTNGDELYIDVRTLVKSITSGSDTANDIVIINVSDDNEVTATVRDNSITEAKLDAEIKASLNLADFALQPSNVAVTVDPDKYIAGIAVGGENKITYVMKSFTEIPALQWGTFGVNA